MHLVVTCHKTVACSGILFGRV